MKPLAARACSASRGQVRGHLRHGPTLGQRGPDMGQPPAVRGAVLVDVASGDGDLAATLRRACGCGMESRRWRRYCSWACAAAPRSAAAPWRSAASADVGACGVGRGLGGGGGRSGRFPVVRRRLGAARGGAEDDGGGGDGGGASRVSAASAGGVAVHGGSSRGSCSWVWWWSRRRAATARTDTRRGPWIRPDCAEKSVAEPRGGVPPWSCRRGEANAMYLGRGFVRL